MPRINLLFPPVKVKLLRSDAQRLPTVEFDFRDRAIRLDRTTRRYLSWFPEDQYEGVLRAVDRARSKKNFVRFFVDPPNRLGRIGTLPEAFDVNAETLFDALPTNFLLAHINEGKTPDSDTLDLRGLQVKINQWSYWQRTRDESPVEEAAALPEVNALKAVIHSPMPGVQRLIDEVLTQGVEFDRLASDPTATVTDVFALIERGKEKLGFLNVSVYRPLRDREGKWILTNRTRYWTEEKGKYDPEMGGHVPDTTLKSVIEGGELVYDVDICHMKSFREIGLDFDLESIRDDFKYARGSTTLSGKESRRMLFIKLVSGDRELFERYGVEGVIQFHNQVRRSEKIEPEPLLPEIEEEARRIKKLLSGYYVGKIVNAVETIRWREVEEARRVGIEAAAPEILIPDASVKLTDDFLFNPEGGLGYPRDPKEYQELLARIVDEKGVFPGDSDGLKGKGTFSPAAKGVSHYSLKRGGVKFQVEIFSPARHAPELENRLIFDADLVSQGASFDAYGTPGVSYDRQSYYKDRLYNAEKVVFIRYNGWPVSFAAMQGYQMSFEGKDLYYAFIHFVMTRGRFQTYGLTSYSIREGMSDLFYWDVRRNLPNLMFNEKGQLKDYRWRMWAAAHSGRFAPFYAFVKGFRGIDPSSDPVAQAIFQDVHNRITPNEELVRRGRPEARGVVQVNGGKFPIAVDHEVYPPHTRYPVRSGSVAFPLREKNLPGSIRETWLETIGGEEGVMAGNGLYFGGLVTIRKIREAKKKEKLRDGKVGRADRAAGKLRNLLIRRSGKR